MATNNNPENHVQGKAVIHNEITILDLVNIPHNLIFKLRTGA
jgi:hypothetical protein